MSSAPYPTHFGLRNPEAIRNRLLAAGRRANLVYNFARDLGRWVLLAARSRAIANAVPLILQRRLPRQMQRINAAPISARVAGEQAFSGVASSCESQYLPMHVALSPSSVAFYEFPRPENTAVSISSKRSLNKTVHLSRLLALFLASPSRIYQHGSSQHHALWRVKPRSESGSLPITPFWKNGGRATVSRRFRNGFFRPGRDPRQHCRGVHVSRQRRRWGRNDGMAGDESESSATLRGARPGARHWLSAVGSEADGIPLHFDDVQAGVARAAAWSATAFSDRTKR
jgi:hypothetical protein